MTALDIFNFYPDRPDRRLAIGDASPYFGQCEGHPPGCHCNRRDVDFCYYTKGETNWTQRYYTPADSKMTPIWKYRTGYLGREKGFLDKIFDWERNYHLMISCKRFGARVITQDVIKAHIIKNLKRLGRHEDANEFHLDISSDPLTTYHHFEHIHVSFERQ